MWYTLMKTSNQSKAFKLPHWSMVTVGDYVKEEEILEEEDVNDEKMKITA